MTPRQLRQAVEAALLEELTERWEVSSYPHALFFDLESRGFGDLVFCVGIPSTASAERQRPSPGCMVCSSSVRVRWMAVLADHSADAWDVALDAEAELVGAVGRLAAALRSPLQIVGMERAVDEEGAVLQAEIVCTVLHAYPLPGPSGDG